MIKEKEMYNISKLIIKKKKMKKKVGKVIILGGGPVGLIAGWQFSEKNWDVKLYEKNHITGGMCRSWRWGEFTIDTGPHIFHTPDKKMRDFWKKTSAIYL